MRKIPNAGLKIYGLYVKLIMYPLMKVNVPDAVLPRNNQSVVFFCSYRSRFNLSSFRRQVEPVSRV